MLSEMEGKKEKSKHLAAITGVCPICDNAGAQNSKLVEDFLETETVVELPNPPYSPDLNHCDVFLLTLLR